MQKDALEPLGGNDSDDDVPVLLSDATRDGGQSKPGAAIDTEEDIEMMDDVLTEVKEWLTFDVLYRTPLAWFHYRWQQDYKACSCICEESIRIASGAVRNTRTRTILKNIVLERPRKNMTEHQDMCIYSVVSCSIFISTLLPSIAV